jgi:hypothetical protein
MKEPMRLPTGTRVHTNAELNDRLVPDVYHAKNLAARRPDREGVVVLGVDLDGIYLVEHEGEGCSDLPAPYHYSEFKVVELAEARQVDYAAAELRIAAQLDARQRELLETGRTSYLASRAEEDARKVIEEHLNTWPAVKEPVEEHGNKLKDKKAFRQAAKPFRFMFEQLGQGMSARRTLIRPEILVLAERGGVTLEEWKGLRANSYEYEHLMPKLTDEALLYAARHAFANCGFDRSQPYRSYNEAVMGFYAPELARRLEVLGQELGRVKRELLEASKQFWEDEDHVEFDQAVLRAANSIGRAEHREWGIRWVSSANESRSGVYSRCASGPWSGFVVQGGEVARMTRAEACDLVKLGGDLEGEEVFYIGPRPTPDTSAP